IASFRQWNGPNIWETSPTTTSVPRIDCTRCLLLLSTSIPLECVPGVPVGLVDEVAERGPDKEDAHLVDQCDPVRIVDHAALRLRIEPPPRLGIECLVCLEEQLQQLHVTYAAVILTIGLALIGDLAGIYDRGKGIRLDSPSIGELGDIKPATLQ